MAATWSSWSSRGASPSGLNRPPSPRHSGLRRDDVHIEQLAANGRLCHHRPMLENLFNDKQYELLLQSGPELDRVEPMLSPGLRDWLVDAQRMAADRYASGTWVGQESGERFTVADARSG